MIKAYIQEDDFGHEIRVAIARVGDHGGVQEVLLRDAGWVPYEQGVSMTSFKLPRPAFDALVTTVLQWAGEKNMRTEPESQLLGKLEATRDHLEDMRKLVFKERRVR